MITILALVAALDAHAAVDVRARVAAQPAHAQVGEPVVLSLVVERPSGVPVAAPKIEPGVVGSWMIVESLGTLRAQSGGATGTVVETTSWRAFALEGGAALPALEVSFDADGGPQKLAATASAVEVPHALAEGEDAARPPRGFREPVTWTGGGPRLALAGLAVATLAGALLALWFVRRRKLRAPTAAGPSASELLARVAAARIAEGDDSGANREVLYSVTWIVRSAIDTHVGEARAARTDSEWLALVAADARVPEGARSASKRLLERAERVKYAGESPTRFATDEALADARAIVEALEPPRVAA